MARAVLRDFTPIDGREGVQGMANLAGPDRPLATWGHMLVRVGQGLAALGGVLLLLDWLGRPKEPGRSCERTPFTG